MLMIPAIDVLNGSCVRLYQGDYGKAQQYDSDPVAVARRFEAAGAKRIHVVDLDAARGNGSHNRGVIRDVVAAVGCEVEVGGGIRSERDVEALLAAGVEYLIVGTLLAKEPKRVAGWVKAYGEHFYAGIDSRNGRVSIAGWEKDSHIKDVDLAKQVESFGLSGIVYTNIAVDGTLEGPDINGTNRIAEVSNVPVILSGGISSLTDVETVCESAHPAVIGMITGKAIYEGALDIDKAIAGCAERKTAS